MLIDAKKDAITAKDATGDVLQRVGQQSSLKLHAILSPRILGEKPRWDCFNNTFLSQASNQSFAPLDSASQGRPPDCSKKEEVLGRHRDVHVSQRRLADCSEKEEVLGRETA